ncbi:hypothetical protein LIER_25377 [Lithospermum erythrorhizon]|uniref:Uncharacterized protein n=1 Tax=Lithospermum erythrorhizon TaxID=34254 RepID=A0AAV3R7V1_LITER
MKNVEGDKRRKLQKGKSGREDDLSLLWPGVLP